MPGVRATVSGRDDPRTYFGFGQLDLVLSWCRSRAPACEPQTFLGPWAHLCYVGVTVMDSD